MGTRSKLHESAWRQGSVIPRELIPENSLPPNLAQDDKLIIVSHDCDVVQPSYETEPYVEFVIARARKPAEEEGNFLRGKNPRSLQVWAAVAGTKQLFQISIHDRYSMPRDRLESGPPDSNCTFSKSDIGIIARWIAKRYTRSGFPNAFNQRIVTIGKKLGKTLSANGKDITGIFITFYGSDLELPSNESYQIAIRIVIPAEAAADQQREFQAIRATTEIQALLAQCKGIELIDIRVDGEDEFTLEDLNLSRAWDFDYLSVDSGE